MNTTTGLARKVMKDGPQAARQEHCLLFERVMFRIHRYFRRVIPNNVEADDCMQQTLLNIEESLLFDKYDPDKSFNVWLWIKARTVFAKWCRDKSKHLVESNSEKIETNGDINSGFIEKKIDYKTVLGEISESLGQEVYEIFILYYESDLTQTRIAEITGRDRKTIRDRIKSANQLTRKVLKSYGREYA